MNEMHSIGDRQRPIAVDVNDYLPVVTACIGCFEQLTEDRGYMLYFALGDFVINPEQPGWGAGQVQSIVGMNVTVNFANVGKQLINCAHVELIRNNPEEWKNKG